MGEHNADCVPPIPTPQLTYYFYRGDDRPPPNGVRRQEGSPALYLIHKASVSIDRTGALGVVLEGPLLKRDGTQGRHNRCCWVDIDAPQPTWLANLIYDAGIRLARVTPPETSAAVKDQP